MATILAYALVFIIGMTAGLVLAAVLLVLGMRQGGGE